MAWLFPQSQTFTNGDNIELSDGQDVWVSQYVLVANEAQTADATIDAKGSNHTVLVDGAVAADGTAIGLGHSTSDSGNSVSISTTGVVRGSVGISMQGSGSEVTNQGQIIGGIYLFGFSGVAHVQNSGTISGGLFGVSNGNDAHPVQGVLLENSGTISGEQKAFSGANGSETIVNTGRMIGEIFLGSDSDYYDGRLGFVDGTIDGGDDDDTIFGGKEDNTILGGSGNDSIYGGIGADALTGGDGSDIFLFFSAKESTVKANGQDMITDFLHGTDVIDLQSYDIDAKQPGIQHLHWIGAKSFSHTAGELRYEKTGTDTFIYADSDGNGKPDFEIHLVGAVKLNGHDFVL